MGTESQIARAGLGLELENSATIITDLRTIHSLMSGIVSLAGGLPKNVGGALSGPTQQTQREAKQAFNSHVADFKAMEQGKTRIQEEEAKKRKKIDTEEKARARSDEANRKRYGPVDQDDVKLAVAAHRRRVELKERADAAIKASDDRRLAQMERNAAKERAIIEETYAFQEGLRRKRLTDARLSDPAYQSGALADRNKRVAGGDVLNPRSREGQLARERFQNVRNDPAAINDPTTIGYRNKTAREIRAFREWEKQHKELRRQEAQVYAEDARQSQTLGRQIAGQGVGSIDIEQRAIYKRSRTDPAARGDEQTQIWRNEMASRLRGYRRARDQYRNEFAGMLQRDASLERKIANDSLQRSSLGLTRRSDAGPRVRYRQNPHFGDYELGTQDIQYEARQTDLISQYEASLAKTFNAGGGRTKATGQLTEAQQIRLALQNAQGKSLESALGFLGGGGSGGGKGPGGGPPTGPGGPRSQRAQQQAQLRDPQKLFNEKGFFTTPEVLGRITRNILLYEVVSKASFGLVNYVQNAVKAAKTTVEFSNALRFATEQASGNIGSNERLADSLQSVGLSRQQGRAAVVEAARFAENRPQDTEALTRTVADIAAARGGGVDKTDELIEQLRRRESKFYKRIFGTTVESIYEGAAASVVDSRTTSRVKTPGLFVDEANLEGTKIKGRTQEIKEYLSQMDDAQKETAIFNYILAQSGRFQGEAEERAATLAGRLDKMAAAWLNAQEGVGLFVTELKPVNDLLEALSKKAGILDALRPPQIGRSTRDGTIGVQDLTQYSQAATSGKRYDLLNTINDYGTTALAGAAGLGASALIGRRQATEDYRVTNYNIAFDKYKDEFDGNIIAAQNEAREQAKGLKPGFVRSVGAGLKKVTYGMTDAITEITGVPITGRFTPDGIRSISSRQVRNASSIAGQQLGAQGSFSLLESASGIRRNYDNFRRRAYDPAGTLGRELNASAVFSALPTSGRFDATGTKAVGRTPTINEAQYQKLLGIQTAAGVGGGLIGGTIGAGVGAIIATKLDVGPIAATTLTIGGALIGNAVGTTVGTAIGAGLVSYIAAQGGLLAMLTGGIGSLVTGAGLSAGAVGAGVVGSVAAVGLAAGGAIGAGINYLNPFDPLSNEQREHDRQAAYGVAAARRAKEFSDADKDQRLLYRDTRAGSATFNQLFNERQARELDPNGFQRGFDGAGRAFKREVFGRNDSQLLEYNSQETTRPTGRLDSLGFAETETVLTARVELEKQLTGEFSNQKQIQDEITNIRTNIAGGTQEEKDIGEARIKDLEVQAQIMTKIANLKTDEDTKREYGTTDPVRIQTIEDFRTRSAQSDANRKAKEEKESAELINQQNNALSKLRDTAEGSFKAVYDVANVKTGEDNPFVKALGDQITLGERMQRTWGHLGDAVVDYQKKLETISIQRQLNQLEFGEYKQASDIKGRAADERAARSDESGLLSRAEQDYLDIQSAIVDKALQLPKLWEQAAIVMGDAIDSPIESLRKRVSELQVGLGLGATPTGIYGQAYAGFNAGERSATLIGPDGKPVATTTLDSGRRNDYAAYAAQQDEFAGLSPQVKKRTQSLYADSVLGVLNEFDPATIRAAGLEGVYGQATAIKAQSLDQNIEDARKKAIFGADADERLSQQLKDDEAFRQSQIALGRNVLDVGRESDNLLLARTDNISPKDLTYDQFENRQQALAREAERVVSEQDEAKAAVQEGLQHQRDILATVQQLRDGVLGGSMAVLMQIQNDTQARVDQTLLEEAHSGKFNLNLDQGATKTNPNGKPLQQRYNKKGYKAGKGGY